MAAKNQVPKAGTTLWIIIGLSLLVHVLSLLVARYWLPDWRWAHHPVHAAVEMTGAIIAVMVAWMLLALEQRGQGTSFNIWIAGALMGMGLLDGFHALVYAGNTFVWLHSTATFVGGLLFACVWLPQRWEHRLSDWWPHGALVVVTLFATGSLLFPDHVPVMVEDGSFTTWATALNVAGGVLLFVAAARLVRTYFADRNVDDLLFCLHCALFGAAAIMFEQSKLWDLPWWGWHLLRLMAYGVALWFVVLTERRTQRELIQAHRELQDFSATLEIRVAERTDQLKDYAAKLEHSNLELQRFAYVASHDLQEPLRSVGGFCGLLQHRYKGKLDETAQQWISQAVEGAQRMSALIRDLLDYSRVESKSQAFQAIDLSDVVDETLDVLAASIEQSDAEVTRDDLPVVHGDRSQIAQLFQNLIGNAVKFCSDEKPRVHVSASETSMEWKISVRDNGIGVDPKFAEAIFDVFKRLHSRDTYPGTGIGLAICRRVVERHGGRIWVVPQSEQGCRFVFTLPVGDRERNEHTGDTSSAG